MHALPLTSLRALAAVYACGGIRPAARSLRIAHSSVSRHLREVEAWLGLPVLDRAAGRRRLVFTQDGEALAKACHSSMSSLQAAAERLKERHQTSSVIVATTPSFAARWLLPRLGVFDAREVLGDFAFDDGGIVKRRNPRVLLGRSTCCHRCSGRSHSGSSAFCFGRQKPGKYRPVHR